MGLVLEAWFPRGGKTVSRNYTGRARLPTYSVNYPRIGARPRSFQSETRTAPLPSSLPARQARARLVAKLRRYNEGKKGAKDWRQVGQKGWTLFWNTFDGRRARFLDETDRGGRLIRSKRMQIRGVNVSDVEDFMSLDGWFQLYRGCRSFYRLRFLRGICDSILFYFVYIYPSNLYSLQYSCSCQMLLRKE